MADEPLSAREKALIAQARAELQKNAAVKMEAAASCAPVAEPGLPAGASQPQCMQRPAETVAPAAAACPAPGVDAAQRIAALMAVARADTERARRQRKMLYVWVPFAFMAVVGMSTLVWMWNKL
jgi:hypothetical protein